MSTLKPLQIDIVSDVVCPWCYIGKRRIENALALTQDVPVEIHWRPFFLNSWCRARASAATNTSPRNSARPKLTRISPVASSLRPTKRASPTGPSWSGASPTPQTATG